MCLNGFNMGFSINVLPNAYTDIWNNQWNVTGILVNINKHEKLYNFEIRRIYWLSNLSILRVPGEAYTRNASCALNLISTFLCK